MKKVILRTRPIHLIVFSVLGLSLFIFMIFMPIVLNRHDADLAYMVIWYIIVAVGIIFCLYLLLSFLEFAIIHNGTITIKRFIFITLIKLPLEKLQYVFIERLPAQPNPGSPFMNWITLCLDKNEKLQGRKYGGNNKKGKSPCQIIATSKNLEILRRYFEIDDPCQLLQK